MITLLVLVSSKSASITLGSSFRSAQLTWYSSTLTKRTKVGSLIMISVFSPRRDAARLMHSTTILKCNSLLKCRHTLPQKIQQFRQLKSSLMSKVYQTWNLLHDGSLQRSLTNQLKPHVGWYQLIHRFQIGYWVIKIISLVDQLIQAFKTLTNSIE